MCQFPLLIPNCKFIYRFRSPGVANAIDLADRFLPKLKSLNCKYFSISLFTVGTSLALIKSNN